MKRFILLHFVLLTFNAFAQESDKKFQPMVGLRLEPIAGYSISGTDTSFTNSISFAPVFSIWHSSGFGIVYAPKFIIGALQPGLYMQEITAGVEQYDKKIIDYAFNYSHYFFSNKTSVPYTPLNNEIYGSINFKTTWLNPFFSAGIGFGNDNGTAGTSTMVYDFGASIGVGHSFKWGTKGIDYSLRPMVLLNGGTNEYFSLLSNTKYVGRSKKFNQLINHHVKASGINGVRNGNSYSSTTSSTTREKFGLNNLELGMEGSMELGVFTFRPTGNIYIPTGSYAGTGLQTYWQLTAEYNF